MIVLEIYKSGQLVKRREVAEAAARAGVRVRTGGPGEQSEIKVVLGQTVRQGEYEVRLVEAPASLLSSNLAVSKATISPEPRAAPQARDPEAGEKMPGGESQEKDQGENSKPRNVPRLEGFELKEQLGKGGMGVVWRGIQLSTKRPVAIKIMAAHGAFSERSKTRFSREVELAARLEHPNIARIYDSGLLRGAYYYVMELIPGVSLDWYAEEHALNQRQIVELFHRVCQAVAYAHSKQVVHRDLKPGNILVTPDGQPHVLDFGLAKALTEEEGDDHVSISMEGDVSGTPAYMAPEQAAGRRGQIGTHSDVYSLGVILYRLLFGRPPHALSGTRYDVTRRIVEEDVQPPAEAQHLVPRELMAIVLRCLARQPEQRFRDAGELGAAVGELLQVYPTLTVRPARAARRPSRWPWIAGGVALAGIGTFVALMVHKTDQPPTVASGPPASSSPALSSDQPSTNPAPTAPSTAPMPAPTPETRVAVANIPPIKPDVPATAPSSAGTQPAERHDSLPAAALTQTDWAARAALYHSRGYHDWGQMYRAGAVLDFGIAAQAAEKASEPELAGKDVLAGNVCATVLLKAIPGFTMPVKDGPVHHAASRFSPDGKYVACVGLAGSIDGINTTQVFSVETRSAVGKVLESRPDLMLGGTFSPDGKHLAVISGRGPSGNLLRVWDWQTGRYVGETVRLDSEPESVTYSPSGSEIAVVCEAGEIVVAGATGGMKRSWRCIKPGTGDPNLHYTELRFSPDGKTVMTTATRTSEAWEYATGRFKFSIGRTLNVAFSPDGHTLAATTSTGVSLYNAGTGQAIDSGAMPHLQAKGTGMQEVWDLRFSSDGSRLLTVCVNDPSLRLWDVKTRALLLPPMAHESDRPWSPRFIEGGRAIMSVASDGLRIWDAATGEPIVPAISMEYQGSGINMTRDGHWATVDCSNKNLQVFDLDTILHHPQLTAQDVKLVGEIMTGTTIAGDNSPVHLSDAEVAERLKEFRTAHPDIPIEPQPPAGMPSAGGAP